VFLVFLMPWVVLAQTTTQPTQNLAATTTTQVSTSSTATATPPIITLPDYKIPSNVEALVRAYFADTPVMIAIAKCESRFRQFADSGNVLNGGSGGMIGVYQISSNVHREFARNIGYDIDTVQGNLGYARYLYDKEGTNPWIDSFPCWNIATNNPESGNTTTTTLTTTPKVTSIPQVSATQPTTISSETLNANLSFGMIHPQVLLLQKILNQSGYVITSTGAGSPGNETSKFGLLTRDAVRRFQCAKGLVCTGDEGTTGYGYVGARTRAALLAQSSTTQPPNTEPQNTQNNKAVQIKSLQDQIDQYTKLIIDLQTQIKTLQSQ
jgi:peptidoglycan hydrolase-like protein with peptidoglycan-binding domain